MNRPIQVLASSAAGFSASRAGFSALLLSAALAPLASAQVGNFDGLDGYTTGLEARVAAARLDLVAPFTAAPGLTLTGGWLSRDIDATANRTERDIESHGAGLSYRWETGSWYASLGAAWSKVEADYDEVGPTVPGTTLITGDVESTTYTGLLTVGAKFGAWRVEAFGAYSSSDNEGKRISDFSRTTPLGATFADFDSDDYALGVRVAYLLPLGEKLLLTPFAGLSTASGEADGFTETGTSADRRRVASFDTDEELGTLGVRLGTRGGSWQPSAALAWIHRFDDDPIRFEAFDGVLPAGASRGIVSVPDTAENFVYASGALDGKFTETFGARLEVYYLGGGDETAWGAQLGLAYSF